MLEHELNQKLIQNWHLLDDEDKKILNMVGINPSNNVHENKNSGDEHPPKIIYKNQLRQDG